MLKTIYSSSLIGDRKENLDRFGHIEGENWSFSYLIDGFCILTPHYVDSLQKQLENIQHLPSISTKNEILNSVNEALIYDHQLQGKASVAFVICLDNEMLLLTAGDTRVYQLDSETRTTDHSLAQKMVDEGKSFKETLHKHPLRKYLIKKVHQGVNKEVLTHTECKGVEKLMLCSDGIWSCFKDDKEIYDTALIGPKELINTALKNRPKNRDNMTLLWLEPR